MYCRIRGYAHWLFGVVAAKSRLFYDPRLAVKASMNSLKLKFLGLTGIILVLAIIGTTWYNLRTQRVMLQKMSAEHA